MPITEIIEDDEEKPELEQPEEIETEEQEESGGDGEVQETADEAAAVEEPAPNDEIVVTIDGEEPAQEEDAKAPQWVKDLRRQQRELQRENRELKKEKEEREKAGAPKPEPVGKRPTLEEFDYDTAKYDAAVDDWYKRKLAIEQAERSAKEAETAQEQAWNKRLEHFATCKSQLKVQDFQDAEATVFAALNVTQQGIIVQGADNPAAVIYALNGHSAKLAELAALKDPVQFAVAIGKLETKLKMTPKSPAPPPERRVTGSGSGKGGALDNTLEKLRAEAAKTGDYTKVAAHRAQLKQRQN